jgi:hypothetical protein
MQPELQSGNRETDDRCRKIEIKKYNWKRPRVLFNSILYMAK